MDGPVQSQQPSKSCTSTEKLCWSLDMRASMLLLTLAGVVILLLLYRMLQLRHRLRLARARNTLEYYSFFHCATYTLKHPQPTQEQSTKIHIPEAPPPLQNATPSVIITLPPPPEDPPPPLQLPQPPVMPPPSLPPPPPVLGLPLPPPVIQSTPPSPHLSWGACSDADVYSRIGVFKPSRLSSLSNHSKVILFEHSSL